MKLTKRDYHGAVEKLAKAGLTDRQLNALEDMILRESVQAAERAATTTKGIVTHRFGGIGSLMGTVSGNAKEAIRVAVYWYHENANQRLEMPEERHYKQYKFISQWRPR